MNRYVENRYEVGDPLVVRQRDGANLFEHNHEDGWGFALKLYPRHIPALRKLIVILEEVEREHVAAVARSEEIPPW